MDNRQTAQNNLEMLQNNSGSNLTSTRKTLNKKRLWISIGAAVIICALLTVLVVIINTPGEEIIGEGDEAGLIYEKNDDYNEILNIFANLSERMSEADLREIIGYSGVSEDYLQINKADGFGYIAATEIDRDADYADRDIEYISFDYYPADEENGLDQIDDIIYHSYRDGKHEYIASTSQYVFTHVYGDYANSFDNINDAIDDYLMRL